MWNVRGKKQAWAHQSSATSVARSAHWGCTEAVAVPAVTAVPEVPRVPAVPGVPACPCHNPAVVVPGWH